MAVSITTTSPLNTATVGSAFSQTLTSSGGTGTVYWTIGQTDGLPLGLTLTKAGVLAGTPLQSGTGRFTITATDSATPPTTASLAVVLPVVKALIIPAPSAPIVLMNAQAATGVGSPILEVSRVGAGSPSIFTWQTSTTGSPASLTVVMEGSEDGITYYTLDSSSNTTGEIRNVVNSCCVYLRANCTALASGTLTVKCAVSAL
jgi:hypothetical protein